MTQHSTRASGSLPWSVLRGRLHGRYRPVGLVLVAALLLAVPVLFDAGSTAQAADKEITGLTLSSPNPGELVIAWHAVSPAPEDHRVMWAPSSGKFRPYKKANTDEAGNAYPTGTSHTVTGLPEGEEYKVRVRARYGSAKAGPFSDPVTVTIAEQNQGKGSLSSEGRSTNPPGKPTGLISGASHNSVMLSWTNPDDDSITGYQVLRGPDAASLTVLADDTGSATSSYTDGSVTAETTYAYAVRARNANGLSPQSDTISVTTLAAPAEEEAETGEQGGQPPTATRASAPLVAIGSETTQQRYVLTRGEIPSGGNEVQWVRFAVTAGHYYKFEAWGVGVGINEVGGTLDDPQIRAEKEDGTYIGRDNNSADGKNARLKFFAAESEEVYFRISDAADPDLGGTYTVLVKPESITETTDCANDDSTTCVVERGTGDPIKGTGGALNAASGGWGQRFGWLNASGDFDLWKFFVEGYGFSDGKKGTIRVLVTPFPRSGAGAVRDIRIELYDRNSAFLGGNDHHLGTPQRQDPLRDNHPRRRPAVLRGSHQHLRLNRRLHDRCPRLRYAPA